MVKSSTPTTSDITRLMLGTLFSTTLRIFAPVTLLFLIGLCIDLNTSTRPWGMLIGTGLGILIAIVLVISQLQAIRHAPQEVK